MGMEDGRPIAGQQVAAEAGTHPGKGGEAQRIVRPGFAVPLDVGVAVAGIEMGRIEHEEVMIRGGASQ